MRIHRDVSDIVNNVVLRDVIQIHGMEIPYPAELWVDGNCRHEEGTAMFSIGDRGYLTAEYFGYDIANPLEWMGMGVKRLDAKLVMKDTNVEIPIWWISSSPKARTWHSMPMPDVTAYKCDIQGLLGVSDSEMNSVSMTVAGLPDIHLGQVTTRIPEETTGVEQFTLRGFKRQTYQLNMEAGEWQIELNRSHADDEGRPLYHIRLTRVDTSPFNLPEDINTSIVNALTRFLSFQCGRWVDVPTIVCNPVFSTLEKHLVLREGETDGDVLRTFQKFRTSEEPLALDELNLSIQEAHGFEDVSGADILGVSFSGEEVTIGFGKGDPTVRLAWVGRLSKPDASDNSQWTAADTRAWPSLFKEFLYRYNEPGDREHLNNCLYHYTEAQRVFDDGSIGQALVAAQSTLQALTRWWNGLDIAHRFGPPGATFAQLLIKAVQKAELGRDSGLVIDEKALEVIISKASGYRHDIDHGRGGNIEGHEQDVIYCRMHHHNLARLLILAKLGNRNRDARGCFAGPMFTEAPN
ncbi:MAG: hypothetical protein OXR67_05180 [Chloroflexota bacterium]|nr:hypothetical protein [Chloroflexota bacterium]